MNKRAPEYNQIVDEENPKKAKHDRVEWMENFMAEVHSEFTFVSKNLRGEWEKAPLKEVGKLIQGRVVAYCID